MYSCLLVLLLKLIKVSLRCLAGTIIANDFDAVALEVFD